MKWFLRCLLAVVGFAALAFALAWITMLLWNWLMPSIFDLRMINYWEAAGLMILGRMLIGSFKGGHSHCGHGGWGHKHHGYWKRRWEDKMANMTPEEREKFKMGMSKCGDWGRWDNCEPDSPKSEHSKI
jgi:hypothetical protein